MIEKFSARNSWISELPDALSSTNDRRLMELCQLTNGALLLKKIELMAVDVQ
jgi:hypothetical protein